MKKIIFLFILCWVSLAYAHAETIVLRTGARVRGTIVFQNEEVVIVRDTEGARFQYPRADVETILTDEEAPAEEETKAEEQAVQTTKKASILVELGGNGSFVPQGDAGGGFSADLLVGSHHIGDRHIFIGGGFGFHGLFIGSEVYNFLPIQAALRMPLIEGKHASMFGIGIGYGIGLSKNYTGGLYAGLQFGYRYQINEKSAIGLLLFADFQQAKVTVTESIDGADFTHQVGRNIVSPGLKFAFYF